MPMMCQTPSIDKFSKEHAWRICRRPLLTTIPTRWKWMMRVISMADQNQSHHPMQKTTNDNNTNQMEIDDESDFHDRSKPKPSSNVEDLSEKLIIDKIN